MTVHCPCPESPGTWLSINGGDYIQYSCGVDVVVTESIQSAYLVALYTRTPFALGCGIVRSVLHYITVNPSGTFGYGVLADDALSTATSIDSLISKAGVLPPSVYLSVSVSLATVLVSSHSACNRTMRYYNIYGNGQLIIEANFQDAPPVFRTLQQPVWTVEVQ